jgi:hypothetical protein
VNTGIDRRGDVGCGLATIDGAGLRGAPADHAPDRRSTRREPLCLECLGEHVEQGADLGLSFSDMDLEHEARGAVRGSVADARQHRDHRHEHHREPPRAPQPLSLPPSHPERSI